MQRRSNKRLLGALVTVVVLWSASFGGHALAGEIEDRGALLTDAPSFDWGDTRQEVVALQTVSGEFIPWSDPDFHQGQSLSIRIHAIAVAKSDGGADQLAAQGVEILMERGAPSDDVFVITYVWEQDQVGVAAGPGAARWVFDLETALDRARLASKEPLTGSEKLWAAASRLRTEFEPGLHAEGRTHLRPPKLAVSADQHAYAHPPRPLPELEQWAKSQPRPVRVLLVSTLQDGTLAAAPDPLGWSHSMNQAVADLKGASRLTAPNAPDDLVVVVWRPSEHHPFTRLLLDVPESVRDVVRNRDVQTPVTHRWGAHEDHNTLADAEQARALEAALGPLILADAAATRSHRGRSGAQGMGVIFFGLLGVIGGAAVAGVIWTRHRARRLAEIPGGEET